MSNKTIAAIRAYEKVGFKKVRKDEKEITINNYLLHEYLGEYGDGDYGFQETEVLIKSIYKENS